MNYLIFITIGLIVLILGAGLGYRYMRKRKQVEMAERTEPDLYAERYFEENLAEPAATINKPNPLFDPPLVDETVETVVETPIKTPEEVPEETHELVSPPQVPKEKSPPPQAEELIIALYVIGHSEQLLKGSDIFPMLEEFGLRYGKMKIYHHYGVGETKARKPVFSVANMIEPGVLNPQYQDFSTPGLVFFMRLPGPFGGRVAFELMLHSAQRLADTLKAQLEDERHQALDQSNISRLRERIAYFEQRQRVATQKNVR